MKSADQLDAEFVAGQRDKLAADREARDWFAGIVLRVLATVRVNQPAIDQLEWSTLANQAYEAADAMMARRAQRRGVSDG